MNGSESQFCIFKTLWIVFLQDILSNMFLWKDFTNCNFWDDDDCINYPILISLRFCLLTWGIHKSYYIILHREAPFLSTWRQAVKTRGSITSLCTEVWSVSHTPCTVSLTWHSARPRERSNLVLLWCHAPVCNQIIDK